jgi:ABC-type branched-subunit amino acid transport system substrate-binding protein
LFGLEVGWDLPEAQHFMTDVYAAKYAKVPATPWANYAYDGTMLVGLAMRQCGPTADCILSKIRDVALTYKGVTGTIEFDKDCQRPNAALLKMGYMDGKLAPLK